MTSLVEFNSISKKFAFTNLFNEVSFQLKQGEITTLVGQNGTGKTTLAKIILGLEKQDSGNLYLKKNIKIGYVPQKLDFDFSMPLTVANLINLLAPKLRRYGSEDKIKPVFDQILSFAKYEKIKNQDIGSISGGELQKTLIAGSLMHLPDLLILDEPTQFLDVTSQEEFYKILKIFKQQFDMTIFMISHDLFTVMKNSDQVICLNGHVCCSGKPSEIDSDSDFKNALSEIGVYIHHHDHKH